MGSNDIPPPHISPLVVPVADRLLQIGGGLWTICYILLARESFTSKSYGMPLLALASNLGWELVYALLIAEAPLEKFAFTVWLVIDIFIVYGFLVHGSNEWEGAPAVKKHLPWILLAFTAWFGLGHWAFAKWWIESGVSLKKGKWYNGVEGIDTTELGFWSAAVAQVILSVASLCQLIVRQHTGGVSWAIWGTRFLGTLIGLDMVYAWSWYAWREATEYFLNPFAIFLWSTNVVCDLIYPFVFARIRRTERVLQDGRKAAGGNQSHTRRKIA